MIKTADCWIETYTGKHIHLLDPKPDEIDIRDIAHSLSLQCRYTGQIKEFYSISDHCIKCSEIVPTRLRLAALLHDASEAYLSDISRPLKRFLPQYQDIENIMQSAIYDKFGIGVNGCLSLEDHNIIKHADNILLLTEARDLFHFAKWQEWGIESDIDNGKVEPLPSMVIPRTPLLAFAVYIGIFNSLVGPADQCIEPILAEVKQLSLELENV